MALTAKKVYAILKRQISDMEAKLNSPVRYRGTVATADLLPLNPDIGDMYNIESKSVYGEAGMNVAWNGVVWDTMGAPIDMSLYIKSSELADWVKQQNKPAYTAEEVGALPDTTVIPSKTSELQNDSGFLTKIPDNYLSGTDKTLSVSGKAADAKATGDKITELSDDISNKLNKNQGSENSGKIAGINESGDIVPMFPIGVEYNSETNCLEFGSDQKMELNQGIGLDSTLTKTGSAADAGATGKEINSLKEDLVKLEYIDYTLTEGKYADYVEKKLATLAETNVVEFDVTNVSKIHYKYTISAVDWRGLYFTNANGIALDGYQTLANSQDISVPDNATKCYATVNSILDIVCYGIYEALAKMNSKIIEMNDRFADVESVIIGEQPVEILDAFATKVDKTSGGITWTWNTDKTEISVVGTRSGTSFNNLISSISVLPSVFEAGAIYNCEYESTDENVKVAILYYVGGKNTEIKYVGNANKTFTIPSDCDGIGIRFQYLGARGTSVDATATMPKIYTIPKVKGLDERTTTLENAVFGNGDNPLSTIKETAGMLSLFLTVGCIGDSLSSGECAYTKEDGSTGYKDLYEHSWGQYLARMTGNTYYNFSKGGLTTKTWLASSYATECFDGEHLCDAYFIGLGQNDKNVSMVVGTTADIDLSNYNNNADTYYGNYGKIIQKLKEHQPKAPIFCFVDPYPPHDAQEYNVAVRNIVDMFGNVYLIDLDTYARDMYRSGLIHSQLRSGHYSALGYQQMAYIIATYVDWIVRNNLDKFSQVEFIGTEYEWVD